MGQSYEYYQALQRKQALQQVREREKEIAANVNKQRDAKEAQIRSTLAGDEQVIDRREAAAVKNTHPLLDKAAIQQAVDRRNVAERMAHLGLTRSGTADAALQGADQRRAVTERQVGAALRDETAALESDRTAKRQEASVKLAKAAQDASAEVERQVGVLKERLLESADRTARTLFDRENSNAAVKKALIDKLNTQLSKEFGEGFTVSSSGNLKKTDDANRYGEIAKRLEEATGGAFTVTPLGNIKQLRELSSSQMQKLNEALLAASDGKYSISPEGRVFVWY